MARAVRFEIGEYRRMRLDRKSVQGLRTQLTEIPYISPPCSLNVLSRIWGSEVRILPGAPANEVNSLDGFMATVATAVGDRFPASKIPTARSTPLRPLAVTVARKNRTVRMDNALPAEI